MKESSSRKRGTINFSERSISYGHFDPVNSLLEHQESSLSQSNSVVSSIMIRRSSNCIGADLDALQGMSLA